MTPNNYTKTYLKKGNLKNWQKLILLSKSPRRYELLKDLNPQVKSLELDERKQEEVIISKLEKTNFPSQLDYFGNLTSEIAISKTQTTPQPGKLYLGADTNVICGGKIYHKPTDKKDAQEMLRSYFSNYHYVITAVSLRAVGYEEVFWSWARVTFVDWRDYLIDDINHYIEEHPPYDKAGSYGIQDLPKHFIKSIEGDPSTIVGLPVSELVARIRY